MLVQGSVEDRFRYTDFILEALNEIRKVSDYKCDTPLSA